MPLILIHSHADDAYVLSDTPSSTGLASCGPLKRGRLAARWPAAAPAAFRRLASAFGASSALEHEHTRLSLMLSHAHIA